MSEPAKITRNIEKTLATVSASWGKVRIQATEPLTVEESKRLRRLLKRAEAIAVHQEPFDLMQMPFGVYGGIHKM